MPAFDDPRIAPPREEAGEPFQVTAGVAALRVDPRPDAEMSSQALHGETVTLYDEQGGFGLVRQERDLYVGWVDLEMLSAPVTPVTHRVAALRTYAFSEPDLKSPPFGLLSLNSLVGVDEDENGFARCGRSGWVFANHLSPLEAVEDDPARVAARLVGAPYLWGGKESLGLDCTGLTQTAFMACGALLPRDSDMQEAWAGQAIEGWDAPGALERGDIVFWKGHCGLMLDGERVVHANAFHMACAIEPLSQAIERIEPRYGRPTSARRIDLAAARAETPDWRVKAGG